MADERDPAWEAIEGQLLRTAARCARGERVTKRDAAVLMRAGRDAIRQLRARVAALDGEGGAVECRAILTTASGRVLGFPRIEDARAYRASEDDPLETMATASSVAYHARRSIGKPEPAPTGPDAAEIAGLDEEDE